MQINQKIETTIYRLPQTSLNLSLQFKNVKDSNWHGSPELKDGPSAVLKNGVLAHTDPGEPIKIKVEIDGMAGVVYEALPGSSLYPL